MVLLASALVAASCGSGDGEQTVTAPGGDIPVLESSRGAAGTDIRDGFVVADGSVLVRAPIPRVYAGAADVDGWWALLFVEGDPSEVMEAYLSQAEDLGFEREEIPAEDPDYYLEGIPLDKQQHTTCGVPAEGDGWGCLAAASSSGGAPCIHLSFTRGASRWSWESGVPISSWESNLLIRYMPGPCDSYGRFLIGDPAGTPPALPTEWPPLPAVGVVLDQTWGHLAGLMIEPESAVATFRFIEGYECDAALLEVSGDPLTVLDAYVAQMEERTSPSHRPTRGVAQVDDTTEVHLVVRAQLAGGIVYTAQLVDYEDGTDTLVLSACPD